LVQARESLSPSAKISAILLSKSSAKLNNCFYKMFLSPESFQEAAQCAGTVRHTTPEKVDRHDRSKIEKKRER